MGPSQVGPLDRGFGSPLVENSGVGLPTKEGGGAGTRVNLEGRNWGGGPKLGHSGLKGRGFFPPKGGGGPKMGGGEKLAPQIKA